MPSVASRNRGVPARLYLPAAGIGGVTGPVPLIVFSHGIGGSREGYKYLGRYFAASGYASLHLQHVGSDRQLWFGNPFHLLARFKDAAQESEAIDRVRDLSFALDRLLESAVGGHVDRQRIIAAGHSYGANTTLLAAGALVERAGRVPRLHDTRIMAAILLSAPPFYGSNDTARILGDIDIPTARGSGGMELNPKVKSATRDLAVAFLNSQFAGDSSALARWHRQNAGLIERFEHKLAGR